MWSSHRPFSSAWEIRSEHLRRIPKSVSYSLIWRVVSGECNLITSRGRRGLLLIALGDTSPFPDILKQSASNHTDVEMSPIPAALWTSSVFSHPSLWMQPFAPSNYYSKRTHCLGADLANNCCSAFSHKREQQLLLLLLLLSPSELWGLQRPDKGPLWHVNHRMGKQLIGWCFYVRG